MKPSDRKPERDNPFVPTIKWLRAEWRYAAHLAFAVDSGLIAPLVPRGTELDPWEGKHYLVVTGRLVGNPKLLGIPVGDGALYAQVEMGFPVRRRVGNTLRRGLVPIRRFAPRLPGLLGRALAEETLLPVETTHDVHFEPEGKGSRAVIEYRWGLAGNRLRVVTTGAAGPLDASPWEKYLASRPFQYRAEAHHITVETAIEHPEWYYWESQEASLEGDLLSAFGEDFVPFLTARPEAAFLVKGSPVAVGRPRRID